MSGGGIQPNLTINNFCRNTVSIFGLSKSDELEENKSSNLLALNEINVKQFGYKIKRKLVDDHGK